jgi:hypothetical protein
MADKIGTDEYGEILIYQTDDGQTNIEVKIGDDTVWLTQITSPGRIIIIAYH